MLPPNSALAQKDTISAWKEEILNTINADEMSAASYEQLLEMLDELELRNSDTMRHKPIKQDIMLKTDFCLNRREGYRAITTEKIAKNKAYLGNATNQTIRYRMQVNDVWDVGFTLNKDAGEAMRKRVPFYDSYSVFALYKARSRKTLQSLAIGDFRVKMASGLLINQQFTMGKSNAATTFLQGGNTFTKHSSAQEYNYMQGVAAALRFGRFVAEPFLSYRQLDAVVKQDTITSIPTDGYHRTKNEAGKRHNTAVLNSGAHVAYRGDWYELGANVLYTRFAHEFSQPLRKYNGNYFRGKELIQWSADYYARRFGFVLRGETAFDSKLNIATLTQLSHPLGEDWNCDFTFRRYSSHYQQLYASALAEGSCMQGETGAMLRVEGSPLPYFSCSIMADYFHFTTVHYGFDAPVRGFDIRAQAQYNRTRYNISATYRMLNKHDIKHNLDLTATYSPVGGLMFKTQLRQRIFSSREEGGYSFGQALVQAIGWNKDTSPLRAEAQCAWFNTPNYNTRIYISEKNVLYSASFPMLYGKGMRYTFVGSCRILQNLVFEMKYSLLHYFDRDKISSGLQQITGNSQHNLWLQMRIKLPFSAKKS